MSDPAELVLQSVLGPELSEEEARKLADLMRTNSVADGDFLITEGVADDSLHVVLSGKLEVVKQTGAGETATLGILRDGDLVGELSFVDGEAHSVGLRALTDCQVLSLDRADFEAIVESDPKLVYKVMRAVARSAHRTMRRMNSEFIELSNYIFKQHGRY